MAVTNVDKFITRWQSASGSERANYQLFVHELCTLPEQVRAVAEVLAAAHGPLTSAEIEVCFTGRGAWKKRLPQIFDTLIAVGRVRVVNEGRAYLAAG